MKFFFLLLTAMLSLAGAALFADEFAQVAGPDISRVSPNYLTNRAPLSPSIFIKLPVGAVTPNGWLGRYMELQRDGLTGKLGKLSIWLEKNDNAWLSEGGSHGWEEVPYWLRGYADLAYILKDADMIAEAKLLPHFESGKSPFSAFKGVSGKDRKISVIAADVALNDTYTTLKGQSRGFANAGCWIHAEFPGDTGYDLRALGDGPLLINMEDDFTDKYPELARISSGKAQVPDSLHVYAPEGAALPGPEFFRKLKNLAGYTTGEMWMSLRENHADFFIRNRFLAAKVNSRTAPTREMIALDPLPEFKRVLEILREG